MHHQHLCCFIYCGELVHACVCPRVCVRARARMKTTFPLNTFFPARHVIGFSFVQRREHKLLLLGTDWVTGFLFLLSSLMPWCQRSLIFNAFLISLSRLKALSKNLTPATEPGSFRGAKLLRHHFLSQSAQVHRCFPRQYVRLTAAP